jgi:hypothetical protein
LKKKLIIYKRKTIKSNKEGKRRIMQIIQEANHNRKDLVDGQEHFNDITRLFGQHYYEEKGNVINIFETILKVWCDIGKNGMKYFKEDMI